MCRVNPTNLISPPAPIAHAAVRACPLFYVVRSQGRGTFAVKRTEVILHSMN